MFTIDYFAPRYFAPRYFAELGADTPPAPPVTSGIRILINGIDRSRFAYDTSYATALKWQLTRGARGICSIPFYIGPTAPFGPQLGERIEIFDPPATRVWAGITQSLEIKHFGDEGWHGTTVSGVTYESAFDSVDLGGIKYGGGVPGPTTCGQVLIDAYMKSGITDVTLGLIQDGPAVESLSIGNLWTGFTDLANLAGFYVYVDPLDMTLNFHAPAARAAARTFGAVGDIVWETLDWTQASTDVRDQQIIQTNAGTSQTPVTETFPGDGTKTHFVLSNVPAYITSVTVKPVGNTGFTISTPAGTADVFVTPAPSETDIVSVSYIDPPNVSSDAPGPGVGHRTAQYTKTRTWTKAGALQESNALLARYSLLPSQLVFSTDKPGVFLARAPTLNVVFPLRAGKLLNGTWLVYDIQASIFSPGMETLPDPWGHFRYQLTMVNTAATAVFQGDGGTQNFIFPGGGEGIDTLIPNGSQGDGSQGTFSLGDSSGPGQFTDSPATFTPYDLTIDDTTNTATVTPPLPPGMYLVTICPTSQQSAQMQVLQTQAQAESAQLAEAISVFLGAQATLTTAQQQAQVAASAAASAKAVADADPTNPAKAAQAALAANQALIAQAAANQAATALAQAQANVEVYTAAYNDANTAVTNLQNQLTVTLFEGDGVNTNFSMPCGDPTAFISNLPDLSTGSPPVTYGVIATPAGVSITPPLADNTTLATSGSTPGGTPLAVMGYQVVPDGNQVMVSPALPPGATMIGNYTGSTAPDVVTNIAAWAQLTEDPQPATPVPNSVTIPPSNYVIGLLLKDLTVGDDVADHVPIYHDGTGLRLLGVLRNLVVADLTI